MTSESPLLWLQNTNTDVWEMLMIQLVKERYKLVMTDLKYRWSYYVGLHMDHYYFINEGRDFLRSKYKYFRNNYNDYNVIDDLYPTRYFAFGLELKPYSYNYGNLHVGIKLDYKNINYVFYKLQQLNIDNNFGSLYKTLLVNENELYKFMCFQEDQDNISTYCSIDHITTLKNSLIL